MTDARAVLPTDVLALVSYGARSYHNEAWTRERMGAGAAPRPISVAIDQLLSLSRARGAWISMRRQRLQGMVGARRRGSNQAWEVDYLIDSSKARHAATDLLERAVVDAGRRGAEKLFLRLELDSGLLVAVREAGFLPYQEEVLYASAKPPSGPVAWNLRQVTPADSYPLYRLYNRSVPETVRRSEASTYAEWRAALDRRWLRNGVQLVSEQNGALCGWVGAVRLPQGVAVELSLDRDSLDDALPLLSSALQSLDVGPSPVFILVPNNEAGLADRLQRAGFAPRQQFVCFMRRTVRPRTLPKAIPAVANTVAGV